MCIIAKGLSKISIWKPFFLLKRNSRQLLENMAEKEENSWVSISIPLLLFVGFTGLSRWSLYIILFFSLLSSTFSKFFFSGLLAPTTILTPYLFALDFCHSLVCKSSLFQTGKKSSSNQLNIFSSSNLIFFFKFLGYTANVLSVEFTDECLQTKSELNLQWF